MSNVFLNGEKCANVYAVGVSLDDDEKMPFTKTIVESMPEREYPIDFEGTFIPKSETLQVGLETVQRPIMEHELKFHIEQNKMLCWIELDGRRWIPKTFHLYVSATMEPAILSFSYVDYPLVYTHEGHLLPTKKAD
jgi:hypothetical protein